MKTNFFGIKFNLDPVAFKIPGLGWEVNWYGIIISLGLLCAFFYCFKRAKDFGIDSDRLMDVVIVTVPSAILGARLYYILFSDLPIKKFFIIEGGMLQFKGLAILGAVIATVIVGSLMCKFRKLDILRSLDLAALGFLIGQSIGRWGNFVNQEAYGSVTGSSWFGISGSAISREIGSNALVHPCFLYESFWCAAGFIVLHMISKKYVYPKTPTDTKPKGFTGLIAILYMMWYGFGRFIIEAFRTDSLRFGWFRVSQLLSALMLIGGLVLFLVLYEKTKKSKVK